MRSFNEIKEISNNVLQENLNDLEKSIYVFLTYQEEELEPIKDNISFFLENYVNNETLPLAKKVIEVDNLEFFLNSDKELVKELGLEYIKDTDNFQEFEGFLDIEKEIFSCNSFLDSLVLSQKEEVFSQDLKDFLQEAERLEVSPTKVKAKIKKVLKGDSFFWKLSLTEKSDKEARRRKTLTEKLKKPIQTGVLALSIFSTSAAFAQEASGNLQERAAGVQQEQTASGDSREAFKQAGRALMETEDGKALEDYAKKQAKKIEKAIKASGAEIPAIILGYGAKVAIERRVGVQGTLSSEQNMKYALESNFQEVSVSVSGDGPDFLDNSKYEFRAGTEEVRFQLGFDF